MFCHEHNLSSLPSSPSTVALYISDRASSLASATITRRLTSITKAHQAAGFADSPSSSRHFVVGETLKGIRRAIGTKQVGKASLLAADIRRIIDHCPDSLLGIRDRALVLTGFAGAFRRSELVAIDFADVSFTKDGMIIDLRKPKTDQESSGRKVGIPFGQDRKTCPVRALRRWLKQARISSGPVFRPVNRHGRVAQRARMKTKPLAGHSLRAGCVTQAAMNGVNERTSCARPDAGRRPCSRNTFASGRCSRTMGRPGSEFSPSLTAEKFGFPEIRVASDSRRQPDDVNSP